MSQAKISPLKCLNCDARGELNWQDSDGQIGSRRTLVGVLGDFHIEAGRAGPDTRVLVCSKCDEIYGVLPAGKTVY